MNGDLKKRKELKHNFTAWMLVAPALAFMLVFTAYPVFRSLYLSLMKYKMGMGAPELIGLENYAKLFSSKLFWKVMGNTVFFCTDYCTAQHGCGIGPCRSGK